ncbi:MAG: LacI family DNA-binding transcriptional regulator [Cyclobacteriaceae bacterium]
MDQQNKPTTIYDIAEKLGLSASTISRAFDEKSRISNKTRQKVFKMADQLHYTRNTFASNLRKGSGATIGVVVPEINHYFFAGIIHGIEKELNKRDYNLLICQSSETLSKERRSIDLFRSGRVDGVIYAASAETTGSQHLNQILDLNIPFVQIDRVLSDLGTNCIVNDNRQGAYKATVHLIQQGYRKIAHLYGPLTLSVYRERKAGYEDALREYGMPICDNWIKEAITEETGKRVSGNILSFSDVPDAFFCAGDYSAFGVLVTAKQKAISVPEQLGIVGFANEPFTRMVSPQISSVEQFSENIGSESARIIMEEIDSKVKSRNRSRVMSYGTELVIRESSKRQATDQNEELASSL